MNLRVLQWLLKHKNVLLQIVDVSKGFRKDSKYSDQWEVVDKIARLVIPILEADAVEPKLLALGVDELDTYVSHDVSVLACGAEVQAMGIDYKLLIDTILPIIIAILEALVRK
jgi:hypothetical protein